MPPTTENIPEKPPFDVYAMMLILAFVFTGGATLLLNDDLDKNWGFWIPKEDAAARKRAVHITQINDEPEQYPEYLKLTKIDREEWDIITKKAPLPEKDFDWPEGFDPLKNPVKANTDNLSAIPADQREKLLRGVGGGGAAPAPAPAPTPPPEAPKTDAPAAPAPTN
jgi:hypothetical protein